MRISDWSSEVCSADLNGYCCASKKRAIHRTSLCASAMAFTMPVKAQESQSEGLAEIIVTAEKREENLQSVPVSVTAMTGEALTANGISNVEDLQFFVPGVSITNDSMAIINIRGIGTSAFGVATDPSTTVHYDGVYISRPTTSYQDLFNLKTHNDP